MAPSVATDYVSQNNMASVPRGHDCTDVAASSDLSAAAAASAAASSDEEPQGPFEGPEKLLELWFADSEAQVGEGLRVVDRAVWEDMLDIVKCKVLSVVKGRDVDAYLLSESSMFVFAHKIILKTCGTTTLLLGLERLLRIAISTLYPDLAAALPATPNTSRLQTRHETLEKKLGDVVKRCFYSRKSFMFPERQKGPHKDWMLEVAVLDRFFDYGSAYTVGKMNGDHWLLYMTTPVPSLSPLPPAAMPVHTPKTEGESQSDQTLEILMTHLSPVSCARFEFPNESQNEEASKRRGHILGSQVSKEVGLSDLFDNTTVDAFAFEPCGFSANAVVRQAYAGSHASEEGYWTVHVTPEEGSSYASFETNVRVESLSSQRDSGSSAFGTTTMGSVPTKHISKEQDVRDLQSLITRVVGIFQPGKLSVTLFDSSSSKKPEAENKEDGSGGDTAKNQGTILHGLSLKGYKRTDRIAYEFEDYDLVFVSFEQEA